MTRFWFSCLCTSPRLCCLLLLLLLTAVPSSRALEPGELLRFGEAAGDQRLVPSSDSTAELQLREPLFFFKETFNKVYINTNGFVSFAKPPAEEAYLGKMPAEFQMIAALLGDLDNSAGQGAVYFRQDNDSDILSRVGNLVKQAFPGEKIDDPQDAIVVTWENMSARGGASGRGDGLETKGNTFQMIVSAMKSTSYAILLYPKDGLKFVHTSVRGKKKILESGFNQGLVDGWFWNTEQGTYYRITTDEETSIWDLTKRTTTGKEGAWVYEIGSSPFFLSILPGTVTEVSEGKGDATEHPVTMLPRQNHEEDTEFTTYRPQEETTEADKFTIETTTRFPTEYPTSSPLVETTIMFTKLNTEEQDFGESIQVQTEYPESLTVPLPNVTYPELGPTSKPTPSKLQYLDENKTTSPVFPPSKSITTVPETFEIAKTPEPQFFTVAPRFPESLPVETHNTPEPRYSPNAPRLPESKQVGPPYTSPDQVQQVPPYSRSHQPQIVVVDEDEDLNVDVFAYNSETCAHNRHRCSAFADCRDYTNGYCCHCRPGFYGNGKDCVAEGKPQRMNGKVTGQVFVGNSPTAMNLTNHDLHSYVVANDGRAYVAISSINKNLGPSLQPLSSLGGVIGWAFALEQPGYQNGFSIVGGVFSRQAEVIFYPGSERLSIKQQFKGIDEHDHLVVSTKLEGRLPALPLGSSVQINPYKEIYHYDRNLITSSSNRDYTITSPEGTIETRSYQWRQTITFESCSHEEATGGAPPTQQLSVDQIFVMFDADNDLIRFAMSNSIGSVHSTLPEQNPCFTGRHSCDINAVCRAGEGLQFACECANGFAGDGRYCYDIDECQENVCGVNAICSNQPGTFRCECLSGHVFASDGKTCIEESRPVDHCQAGSHDCDIPQRAYCSYSGGSAFVCSCLPGFVGDGRVCQDVDECVQNPCHGHAHCSNTAGSFKCQCLPGFQGDGFHCTITEREKTACERHRESAQISSSSSSSGIFSFFRPRPAVGYYVPQCDQHGAYESTQCHTSIGQCWCVDAEGKEIPNTRTGPGSVPLCIDQAVTPSPIGPTPRPNLNPMAPGTHLLFAQSGRIEHVPLDGYIMRKDEAKPLLHIPDRVVIAVAYDCVDKMVYWSDITGPAISRASLTGGDISHIITKDLESPEGLAVDHVSRLLFWTDSMRDKVEVSKMDGSHRRVLFDTDLVNPRAIVVNSVYGRIYWADWNRDGPKIEMSNMDGTDRVILVKDDLGLPNGLSFDQTSQQLCWADAGTRKVECMDPHRMVRRTIVDGIHYPFGLVSFGRNLYYTDWRREAVVAVDLQSQVETEDFLPQKRSRLYGITTTNTQCPQAYNYCADNGGCSHLCLPRLGGATCRCPDDANTWCEEGKSL